MSTQAGVYWLASSDAEIGRAREILKTLQQPGVLDELGFLVLLGALSDRLYPAMNTVMTRARYLVFVPALLRHLEDKLHGRGGRAQHLFRDLQYALCRVLCNANESEFGIIGKQSGRDINRTPSNIYWTALAELGIATQRQSEAAYLERLARGFGEDPHHRDDDKALQESDTASFWDHRYATPDIIDAAATFSPDISLDLTRLEAMQLRDRYATLRPNGGESLFTHLVKVLASAAAGTVYPWPWEVPNLPGELANVTSHARLLSTFAKGAELQYHAMLFEAGGNEDTGTKEAFIEWHHHSCDALASWDLAGFAAIPCVQGAPRALADCIFINAWKTAVAAKGARAAYHDSSTRDLIRRREREMRRAKARLNSPFHLASWKAPDEYRPDQLYALSYRHAVATRFATDVVRGLRRPR